MFTQQFIKNFVDMKNKGIYLMMDNPTLKQRLVIMIANLLLWLIITFFSYDKDKIKKVVMNVRKFL
jgi:hypothetical protein